MNKLILLALLALCINVINGATCGQTDYKDGDDCSLLQLTGEDTHCCYIDSEASGYPKCEGLTDDQYENIKKYKDYLRTKLGDDDLGIDCSSKYMSLEIFAIFALLLL